MTDAARELLQELMSPYQQTVKDFKKSEVCKNYLVNFCPKLLFTNTKADLGPCNLVHDDKLKEAYAESEDYQRLGYEEEFYAHLSQILNDLDRRIRRATNRVTAEADEKLLNPRKEEKEEKAVMLEEKIKALMTKIEEAGEEGRVEEAESLTAQVEKLQADLENVRERIDSINPMFKNEKRLEVCDVCGALLVPNDASKRLDAHIEGKQHQGFIRIREAFKEGNRGNGRSRDGSRSRYGRSRERDHYGSGGSRRRHKGRHSHSRSRSPESHRHHHRGHYKDRDHHYRGRGSGSGGRDRYYDRYR